MLATRAPGSWTMTTPLLTLSRRPTCGASTAVRRGRLVSPSLRALVRNGGRSSRSSGSSAGSRRGSCSTGTTVTTSGSQSVQDSPFGSLAYSVGPRNREIMLSMAAYESLPSLDAVLRRYEEDWMYERVEKDFIAKYLLVIALLISMAVWAMVAVSIWLFVFEMRLRVAINGADDAPV